MVLDGNNNCIELNECETNNGGCWVNDPNADDSKKAICTNLLAYDANRNPQYDSTQTRTCECPAGYFGDGLNCKQQGLPSYIQNMQGMKQGDKYPCWAGYAGAGYQYNGAEWENHCSEINECEDPELNTCHTNAKCTNLEPLASDNRNKWKFTCTCKDGFIGDGTDQCNDINECELGAFNEKMIMLMVINVIF